MLTVAEVAKRLHSSISNVYALVAQGALRCYRVGAGKAGIRFSPEQLENFLRQRESQARDETEKPAPAPKPPPAGTFKVLDAQRLKQAWER